MLLLRQPLAELGEECGAGLDPFGGDRRLEIGEDALPQLRVRLRARHEIVQGGACGGQLLRRAHPTYGRRRKASQKLAQFLLVVPHVLTSPDPRGGSILPSKRSRSFARQREIRLATVPEGRPSASPMVR